MDRLSVLFICIGNSCRSPMAEAMARAIGDGRIEARSAGVAATGRIAAGTKTALERLGYSAEGLSSKDLEEVRIEDQDAVVSLIGAEGLSFLPRGLGGRLESWSIRDPYGDDDEVYLAVARDLEQRIQRLLDELLAGEHFPS